MTVYHIYILASDRNGTLYIGVTNNLHRRLYEHKHDLVDGFTKQYRVHRLVYIEATSNIRSALEREKQLKWWKRAWKIALIEQENPEWQDLLVSQEYKPRRHPEPSEGSGFFSASGGSE